MKKVLIPMLATTMFIPDDETRINIFYPPRIEYDFNISPTENEAKEVMLPSPEILKVELNDGGVYIAERELNQGE